ncbi:unnamed protein product [Prunus brigantina]
MRTVVVGLGALDLREICIPWLGCVKRSIFSPIHCIASTSSEDLQVNV